MDADIALPAESRPLIGILLKVLSVCVFVTMFACIKAASTTVPVGEAVFFRSIFALPPILIWLAWRGGFPGSLHTKHPLSHVLRGIVGVSAMGLSFLAVGLLPFPEAIAIGYAAPLLATLFAAMFIGERLRAYRLSAIALGMAGVLVVLSPRLGAGIDAVGAPSLQTLGAIAALFSAVLVGLVQVFVRKMVFTETTAAIVFWFTITSATCSLFSIPFGWVMPAPSIAMLLVLSGLLGGIGQILVTESYRHAETAVIAPFEYTSMLFSLLIGYFIFAEAPTGTMLGGAALVVLAGLVILRREHQLGLERKKERAAAPTQGQA